MKAYLAAPYAARDIVREYADELRSIGYTITSSWLDEKHEINSGTTGAATSLDDAQVAAHAHQDLIDIHKADVVVLFTAAAFAHLDGGTSTSGGRHVETGYAIALDLPVLVVGEPENVFHRLGASVQLVSDWHAAVLDLAGRLVDHERDQAREYLAEASACAACSKASR